MIPKKIHYCWFGRGEKPKLAQKCIASWQKYCPDYEIIEWNEDNFNLNLNEYTKWCYENKKYAFLSDYVRLWVVEQYGGVYFDTDVEVVRSIDDLLDNKAFFGFESLEYVNTGLGFGAEVHHSYVQQMLAEYEPLLDGKHETIGCPILNTQALVKFGLKLDGTKQALELGTVYPVECFNPCDSLTGKVNKADNTYTIHWYSASWLDSKAKLRNKVGKLLRRLTR